jgi:hypothetical protein
MSVPLLGVLALAYSGLVLFTLAQSLRRILGPRRAVWGALGLSAAVHGPSAFLLAEPDRWLALTLFWLLPHLLLLPLLVLAARRQRPNP